jgi:hypothetical protein
MSEPLKRGFWVGFSLRTDCNFVKYLDDAADEAVFFRLLGTVIDSSLRGDELWETLKMGERGGRGPCAGAIPCS